jgi:hypothetical protein
MTRCLFVGGPRDGEVHDVPDILKYYEVGEPGIDAPGYVGDLLFNPADRIVYKREMFVDTDHSRHSIFVLRDCYRPLAAIIDGYARLARLVTD